MRTRRGLALAAAVPVLTAGLMSSAGAAFAGTGQPVKFDNSHSQADQRSRSHLVEVKMMVKHVGGKQHYGYVDHKGQWHEKSYSEYNASQDHSCWVSEDQG